MAQSHTMRSSVRQQGVALIISMILLLVITLIGVAVMGGSRLEWLMANNSHFQSDAAMRADATLRVAESKIIYALYNGPWAGEFYDDSSPAPTHPLPYDPSVPANWSLLTKASANTDINAPAGTDNDYLIDHLGCTAATPICANTDGRLYRVWSRSTDSKGTTRISVSVVLLQGGPPSIVPTPKRIAYAEIQP